MSSNRGPDPFEGHTCSSICWPSTSSITRNSRPSGITPLSSKETIPG